MADVSFPPLDPLPGPGASGDEWFSWAARGLDSLIAAWNSPDLSPTVSYLTAEKDSAAKAVDVSSLVALWEDVSENPQKLAGSLPKFPFDLIAWILRRVTGLTISGDQIEGLFDAGTTAGGRSGLGKILTDLYGETLKTEKAAAGWLARNPGESEYENFRQLAGAAMRLALGGLVAEWGGDILPFGLGKFLEGVTEKLNDAVALDDALEEVVQVPMQAVIQRGLEAKYNRELKPGDFSGTQAIQAMIAYDFPKADVNKVLDNEGVRDDIRETLINFTATNLTETDINDLYQHNLLSRDEVKEQYKQKFFQEPEREFKTKLVEGTRRWKLEGQVNELYGNLYRDGVATKQEVTPHLEHFGYDPDEIEMWFQVQELERRQRRWLTKGETHKLVKAGKWTPLRAIEYQVMQGMTIEDATLIFVEDQVEEIEQEAKAIIKALPVAVKNKCDDLLDPKALLAELLAKLLALIPLGLGGNQHIVQLIKCALEHLGATVP